MSPGKEKSEVEAHVREDKRQKIENPDEGFVKLSLWVKSQFVFNVNVNNIRKKMVKEFFLQLEVGSDKCSMEEVDGSHLSIGHQRELGFFQV